MVEDLDRLDRQGARRAASDRAGEGHRRALRQRQRRRAVLLQLAAERQQGQRPRGRHPGADDPVAGRAGSEAPGRTTPRCYTSDWTATFLELAGAEPDPAYAPTAPASCPPASRADVPERDLFWRMRAGRALRRGNLKYVRTATAPTASTTWRPNPRAGQPGRQAPRRPGHAPVRLGAGERRASSRPARAVRRAWRRSQTRGRRRRPATKRSSTPTPA